MKTAHRIQEWFADRVSWVQYPNLRPADEFTRDTSRSGVRFKHQMPIGKRIDLIVFSFFALALGLAAAAILLFLAYALLFQ